MQGRLHRRKIPAGFTWRHIMARVVDRLRHALWPREKVKAVYHMTSAWNLLFRDRWKHSKNSTESPCVVSATVVSKFKQLARYQFLQLYKRLSYQRSAARWAKLVPLHSLVRSLEVHLPPCVLLQWSEIAAERLLTMYTFSFGWQRRDVINN